MMTSTNETSMPRTANLLACKQWWKVCFLYGDQEKYYRQIYGKAASERIAMSTPSTTTAQENDNDNNVINCTNKNGSVTPIEINGKHIKSTPSLFSIKQPSRRRSKISSTYPSHQQQHHQHVNNSKGEIIKTNSKVTVLDDPFLMGGGIASLSSSCNEHANLSEDSGIDNAAFENQSTKIKKNGLSLIENKKKVNTRNFVINDGFIMCNQDDDLNINKIDMERLNCNNSRNRNGVCCSIDENLNFSGINNLVIDNNCLQNNKRKEFNADTGNEISDEL